MMQHQVPKLVRGIEPRPGLVVLRRVKEDERPRPVPVRERIYPPRHSRKPDHRGSVRLEQAHDMRHRPSTDAHRITGISRDRGDFGAAWINR